MSCEIKTLPSGSIKVETYPQLFREVQNYTRDQSKALSLYGMTLTDEFKDLNLTNPTLEDLLQFVDNYNSFEGNTITKAERQLFMDITLNSENPKEQFIDAFTVNGVFGVNVDEMRKSELFTESEILDMMNSDNLTQLQKLYYKLKENNEEFVMVNTPFVISDGTQFGKLNPDKVLTNVYENYIGLETADEVVSKANEIADEVVIENPALIPAIIQMTANKQKLASYETDGEFSDVVRKEINNTKVTVENTLDGDSNFQPILNQLEFILGLSIEQFAYDYADVQRYILNIEKQALKSGLDISNLSETIPNKSYNEVQDYLTTLYNFLTDVQNKNAELLPESFDNFVTEHNTFFQITPQYKNSIIETVEDAGVFLNLETNRTEQELFQTNSIIKIGENTYQKVNDNKTQEELNELLETLIPQTEDIDSYITEQSKELLNPNADIEVLKRITSYKILLGVDTEVEEVLPDSSYLKRDKINVEKFVVDFNKYILQNPKLKDIFYFSNRGLEAKQEIGQYTINQLKNELSESMFDRLQQYALISNNQSLQNLKPEYSLIETDDVNILRDFYSNNLNQLKELSTPYQVIDTGVIAENITDSFVKVRGELYEQIEPNIYEKIEIDTRFRNYGLTKPESSIENPERYLSPKSKEAKIKVKTTNIEDSEIEFC